ncbi:response regulator [Caballeronia sordidicola]|uniref:response regulator n=1 Tax=Caballeronia sordidicola TaxID=196367 RepID=UPI00094C6ED2|nr:response regulator [Caballeronia sordidicola]
MKVLFVDDQRDLADMMADLASGFGHETQCAYDGATALERTSHEAFDVVILDISLPDLDGEELCRLIRKGRSKEAQVIALTGHRDLGKRADLSVFDSRFLKPITVRQLRGILDRS